jgi:ParB-like chromosome segregation protein Spo0J
MKIETIKVDALVPYARNSRTHSEEQVVQIVASIREFGFTNPVLIDGDGGIIAGHGRVLAARKMGLATVPCLRLAHLSEAQKRAYIIADNKLALNAGWDDEMLALELRDLQGMDFDLTLTGFEVEDIEKLLDGVESIGMPVLPSGEKSPFQQMTFTLHDSQAEQVTAAMQAAAKIGPYVNSPNENSNGNALARICETFLNNHGKR